MTPQELTDLGNYCVKNPAWQAKGTTTFCNFSTNHAGEAFGCKEFLDPHGNPFTANQICGILKNSKNFRTINFVDAQAAANKGQLVVCAYQDNPHGHVCFCVPGKLTFSGSYNAQVPMVANVGPAQYTGIKSLNWAYSAAKKPTLYLYIPSTVSGNGGGITVVTATKGGIPLANTPQP